jgi:transcription initiation factor TFIIB
MKQKRMKIKQCPECGGHHLKAAKDKGEVICQKCGLVVEDELVDFDKEWRELDEESESRRRTGAPLTYTHADQGLGTEVGRKSDLYKMSKEGKNKFFRLRRWQRNVASAIERNLQLALTEIQRLVSQMNLSSVVEEEASRLYTMAAQKGLIKGRSTEKIVAAAIYIACRNHGVPKTLDDVEDASGITKKEIGKNYRYLTRNLNIKVMPSDPVDYVGRYISALNLSPMTQTKAVEIIEEAQRQELTSGKSPVGIAAAAIYTAAKLTDEKATQQAIADKAGVTEVTIRNRYRELVENIEMAAEAA